MWMWIISLTMKTLLQPCDQLRDVYTFVHFKITSPTVLYGQQSLKKPDDQFKYVQILFVFQNFCINRNGTGLTFMDSEDEKYWNPYSILNDHCISWTWTVSTLLISSHANSIFSHSVRILWAFSFHGWGKVWTCGKQLRRLSTAAALWFNTLMCSSKQLGVHASSTWPTWRSKT